MLKKAREGIWNFIVKRKEIIFFIIITLLSLWIRTLSIDFESGDMYHFLRKWYEEIKLDGGFTALKNNIGDYNIPYLVIIAWITYLPIEYNLGIKIVSIFFDYVLAISAMMLVRKLLKDNSKKTFYSLITYAITLLLPALIYNSACWGQCDTIYASFAILALLFFIDEKYIRAFILLGISFSFKLQSVFLLPAFLLVYIQKRKFPLIYFLIIPIVNILMCSPALMAGRPFADVMKIYINQTSTYDSRIVLNSPSIHNLYLKADNEQMVYSPRDFTGKIGTLVTISIFGIMAFISLYKKNEFDKFAILELSLWSVMICVFMLPSMHERYGIIAEVLSVVYFIVNKEKLYLPITLNLITLGVYSNYLYDGNAFPLEYLSLAYCVVLILFTKDMYKKYFDVETEEKLMLENERK